MNAIGGSLESVNLSGREFKVAADTDSTRSLGGFSTDFEMNGDGTGRPIKTRVPAMFSGLVIEINDDRGDQEFIQNLSDAKDLFVAGVTYVGGATYQGRMTITGELNFNSQNATMTIELKGPAKLTKQ